MARLRMFAGLREAAGTGEAQLAGGSVGEVLEEASRRYGSAFELGLATAAIWVNGEPADRTTPVADQDEVALLPPVSGGAETVTVPATPVRAAAAAGLAALALVANIVSVTGFVTVLVGIAVLWVWDAFDQAERWDVEVERWPVVAAAAAGALGAYRWSSEGLGVAAGFVVVAVFVWALARPVTRTIASVAGTLVAALAVAAATGSLVLVRLDLHGQDRVSAFIVICAFAAAAMWAARNLVQSELLDPHTASALGAVAAGLIAGIVWETSVLAMVLAAAAVAGGLLAGRAFGSLLRTGDLYLAQPLPGWLDGLDGAVLAAPLFWMVLALAA